MIVLYLFVVLSLVGFIPCAQAASKDVHVSVKKGGASNEVFVGPFANWINAKTGKRQDDAGSAICTAATGNGSSDDTVAIKSCLDALGSTAPVLYFPAGTYKITAALTTTNKSFISVIGASPAPACSGGIAESGTVCIVWGGAANAKVMLDNKGLTYSRFDRLTFNGNNAVGILVSDNQVPAGNFNTGNEYADNVFINAGGTYNSVTSNPNYIAGALDFACGFMLDTTEIIEGGGCAETSLLRNHHSNGVNGIAMGNQNAADMWVWHSTFTNKNYGLWTKYGDFHVFNTNFANSATADIRLIPNADQYFFGNYSSGSNQFIHCEAWGNTAPKLIERNTVVNTTQPISIECDDQGPVILIDNFISSCTIADGCASNAAAPAVRNSLSPYPSDVFSTGNQYTVGVANVCNTSSANAVQYTGAGRCTAVGDTIVAHSHPSTPPLPGVPPQYCASGCPNTVSVQEIVGGSSGATIQAAIDAAAATDNGAIVHLQAGSYTISTPLSVPGNKFIQIIGDGDYTVLNGGGASVITCGSACKAWFRDFQISGAGFASIGIKITGADQAGGRVFVEQLTSAHNNSGVLVNGLVNSNVEIHNSSINDILSGGDAIKVIGGSGTNVSYTKVFAMQTACNNINFVRTSGNANFTLRHLWEDLGGCDYDGETVAQVTGSGTIAMAAARLYVGASPPGHYFNMTNFSGASALVGMYATTISPAPADTLISGSLAGNNLSLGYGGCQLPILTDTAAGDHNYFLAGQLTDPPGCGVGNPTSSLVAQTSQNVSSLSAFLATTLRALRVTLPSVPGQTGDPALASGVTDARIYRILMSQTSVSLDVEP